MAVKLIRLNSISSRFTGLTMVFILMACAVSGIIGGGLSWDYTNRRFHDNFRILSDYLAKNAELGLMLKDADMLKNQARHLLALDDIYRVKIMDTQGTVLVDVNVKNETGQIVSLETKVILDRDETDGFFLDERDITPPLIGYAVVEYSLDSLKTLQMRMLSFFALFVFIFVILSAVCFLFLSKSITNSLEDILGVSRAVSGGNLDVRAKTDKAKSLKEVDTLAAGFNDMLDALQIQKEETEQANREMAKHQTLAEVGKFSMMVAHEVKNPLSVIKGSLDILKKDSIDHAVKNDMIVYVEEEIQRINKIVEDFLIFAKPRKSDFSDTDMNAYTTYLLDRFSFVNDKITIEDKIEKKPCICRCDCEKMDRAITNILLNASMFATSVITVVTGTENEKWRLQISDDGPGIDDDKIDRVFDPFFTTRAKGTGLGLAITKDMINLHKASIHAGHAPSGKGAMFEVIMECS